MSDDQVMTRGRKELFAVVAIAFLPFAIAWILFVGFPSGDMPDETSNRGSLINPPVPVVLTDSATPAWVLIHVMQAHCDEQCQQVLYLSRQARKALGKKAGRVRRVVVANEDLSEEFMALIMAEHRSLTVLRDQALVIQLSEIVAEGDAVNHVFLMDPLGNVMMFYGPDKVGKAMLEDLRHLLRVSRIG